MNIYKTGGKNIIMMTIILYRFVSYFRGKRYTSLCKQLEILSQSDRLRIENI